MQLYAKDLKGGIVFVDHAERQKDYDCIECGSIVRVRGGMHRQNHFYHLEAHRLCHLNAKSMAHIQVQCYLQNLFSPENCLLEHGFPEIRRIADVVWIPQRIIFEIQCSPITADEVEARNQDYGSIGYQVIWILHDRRFNQWRLTAAEKFLKGSPHYYTNIDAQGQGIIYDQYSLLDRGIRRVHLNPLDVNLSLAYPLALQEKEKITSFLPLPYMLNRIQRWPFCFSGDLLARCLFDQENFCKSDYWLALMEAEETLEGKKKREFSLFSAVNRVYGSMKRLYQFFFYSLLEKMCK